VSRSFRAGLLVLGFISFGDVLLPLLSDGEHPPMAVALVASAFGLISLALVISAWRGATRAAIPLVIIRALMALTAVPAFTAPGVPGPAMVAAGFGIGLTAIGVVLVVYGMVRRPVVASA
jgi:hypothetical protein